MEYKAPSSGTYLFIYLALITRLIKLCCLPPCPPLPHPLVHHPPATLWDLCSFKTLTAATSSQAALETFHRSCKSLCQIFFFDFFLFFFLPSMIFSLLPTSFLVLLHHHTAVQSLREKTDLAALERWGLKCMSNTNRTFYRNKSAHILFELNVAAVHLSQWRAGGIPSELAVSSPYGVFFFTWLWFLLLLLI